MMQFAQSMHSNVVERRARASISFRGLPQGAKRLASPLRITPFVRKLVSNVRGKHISSDLCRNAAFISVELLFSAYNVYAVQLDESRAGMGAGRDAARGAACMRDPVNASFRLRLGLKELRRNISLSQPCIRRSSPPRGDGSRACMSLDCHERLRFGCRARKTSRREGRGSLTH
jgi:hypothetical protein